MAFVLSLRPHSPLKRSFSDNPYLASSSPLKDVPIGALRDITSRNPSACSFYSLGSNKAGEWLRGTENTPPLATCSLLDLVSETEGQSSNTELNHLGPRKRSCGINRPAPSFARTATPANPYSRRTRRIARKVQLQDDELGSYGPTVVENNYVDDGPEFFNLLDAIRVPLPEGRWSENTASESMYERGEPESPEPADLNPRPFRRWMSTLRRRHLHQNKDDSMDMPNLAVDMVEGEMVITPPIIPTTGTVRRFSDSMSSSLGCVTAVRSVSVTIASASIAPRSDAGAVSERMGAGKRSSYFAEARKSTDSHGGGLPTIIDEGAWTRSVQRRRIVEELISTEESYIADLKVLINASLVCSQRRFTRDC